jgi:hypothetical protein
MAAIVNPISTSLLHGHSPVELTSGSPSPCARALGIPLATYHVITTIDAIILARVAAHRDRAPSWLRFK